tara:strand:- start:127 stop:336 length:210 start_codon:yes stop_codon:yes gene_type:complete
VSKYKVGDLVRSNYAFAKGYIVAIREDLEDPEDKKDLVYDIQWFGHDQIDRMIDIWFKPLRTEVEQSGM